MSILVDKLRKIHPAIWLSLVTIVFLGPFLNKPFNMDDPLFIWTAKHIQAHPMADFYGFPVNWYGSSYSISIVQQNPPLLAYYLALVGNFFGWSEWVLHTAMLMPALMVVLGTWKLAQEFVTRPWLAALATLFTPAIMVSSTTVMCDVLMLGFWIWTVIFWMRGLKDKDGGKFFIAGLLLSLSALTKYYGIAAIPLLALYSLMKTRRLGVWVLYFLVPVVILAGYQWITAKIYGHGLLSNAAAYANDSRERDVYGQLVLVVEFVGAAMGMVVFFAPFLWSKRQGVILLIIGLVFVIPIFFRDHILSISLDSFSEVRAALLFQLALLTLAGVHLLALMLAQYRARRNAESMLLFFWISGSMIFAVLVNWTINVRSLLPVAPAIAILLVSRLEQRRCGLGKTLIALVPGALLALSVTWADYDYASICRRAAAKVCQTYGGNKLWFQGHWGFQYYMEQFGAHEIDFNQSKLAKGDLVISPDHNTNLQNLDQYARVTDAMQFFPHAFLAVSSPRYGGGFYSTSTGLIPFYLNPALPEEYGVLSMAVDLNFYGLDGDNHIVRGKKYLSEGNSVLAMEDYRFALRFEDTAQPNGLAVIAWQMATDPNPDLRDGPRAVALAQKAARLTKLQTPSLLDVLGAAYAEAGRMPEAMLVARAAIAMVETEGKKDQAEIFRQHLAVYQTGRPFREMPILSAKK